MDSAHDKTIDDFKNALLTDTYVPLVGEILRASLTGGVASGVGVINVLASYGYSKLTADDYLSLLQSTSAAALNQLEDSSQVDRFATVDGSNHGLLDQRLRSDPGVDDGRLDIRIFAGIYVVKSPSGLAGKILRVDPENGRIIFDRASGIPEITPGGAATWSHGKRSFSIKFRSNFHAPSKILTASFHGTVATDESKSEVFTGVLRDQSIQFEAGYAPFVDAGMSQPTSQQGRRRSSYGTKPFPFAVLYESVDAGILLTYLGFGISIVSLLGIVVPAYWCHVDHNKTSVVLDALQANLSSIAEKVESMEEGLVAEVQQEVETIIDESGLDLEKLRTPIESHICGEIDGFFNHMEAGGEQAIRELRKNEQDLTDVRWKSLLDTARSIIEAQIRTHLNELAGSRVDKYLETWGTSGAKLLSKAKIDRIKSRGMDSAGVKHAEPLTKRAIGAPIGVPSYLEATVMQHIFEQGSRSNREGTGKFIKWQEDNIEQQVDRWKQLSEKAWMTACKQEMGKAWRETFKRL